MAVMRIREISGEQSSPNATLSFEHGEEFPITISDPFSEAEEQQLAWYFEDHLRFPFTRKVQAKAAAGSIITYGEALFGQVFADREAYAIYKDYLQAGLNAVQVEIAGSPQFHAFHWEALKDPHLPQPLVLQGIMMRKNLKPSAVRATVRSSPTINLLIVTSRPFGKQDVGYRTISRPMIETLGRANIPVQIEILRPGTYKALENHLREISAKHGVGYYHVIHFDVHGAVLSYAELQQEQETSRYLYNQRYGRQDLQPFEGVKAFLALESEQDNQADLVEAAELADLLISHHVPIAILNACQSGKQIGASETSLGSRLMQAGVQMVLAMGYSVTVSAAELLMKTLYTHLFASDDLSIAIRHARTELYNRKARRAYFDQQIDLEDWLLPVAHQNQPLRLGVREFTPQEREAFYAQQAELARTAPREPRYGFVGRDLDILHIEKRLLTRRNILLLRGMGGAGKTTLLQHLSSWWRTTGLVDQVFYFGYDETAWTRQQIMVAIAQKLLGLGKYYSEFQPLSLDAQQAYLAGRLRAENHLLILDNLESITGTHLAIQHTLPPCEQAALHSFLIDLARGHTLVLLGSRSGEDWLAKGTFDDNVYDLGGLDDEAASTLADRILERNHATRYRKDEQEQENLRKLIKVLDGFPLALEVVLANLAHQTPAEVLAALQAGDVSLDIDESKQQGKSIFEQKTESILRCIDYSHSNLSPEAQQLLLCLAPFTSVIDTQVLNNYTNHLRQQPALASLPFGRWPEVIGEAQNWGLLSPDPDIPRFLSLQPIFPYFLRNRLHEPAQADVWSAIETAFREHYDEIGGILYQALESKDPQERRLGQILTSLDYENLVTALNLALAAQVSILSLYFTLSQYLDATQNQRQGLELGQAVLKRLESYSPDKLAEWLGAEFVAVIDNIAKRQLALKQYAAAEASYQKALAIHLTLKIFDAAQKEEGSASIYHQLGMVAQEQRQWAQAEQYYQQALQLKIEYNDRYRQASTYHQLGRVAQEQRQWEQAEQYYQQALQLKIEYNDRYAQASTYLQLGVVAHEQRQWQEAEQYYQQALQIYIDFNDHYKQAKTYHGLGNIAAEQRQWQEAEQYYQQALQIYIEYNDRYEQAAIYYQLGRVAEEQVQWQQARDYFLHSLEIVVAFDDPYHRGMILQSLARLWRTSNDTSLPAAVATILGASVKETEELLRKLLDDQSDEPGQ
jgi:tetratricopeptide (TPR) repeat protein